MKLHRPLSPRQEALHERALYAAVLELETIDEARAFFRDLCAGRTPGHGRSLLDSVGIRHDLQERLARRVDLVEYDAIKPALRERVMSEQVPIL